MVFIERGILFRKPSLLNHCSIKEKFSVGTLDNFFLDSTFADESENLNRFGLPNTMSTILNKVIK
jgi:hypothetical protein